MKKEGHCRECFRIVLPRICASNEENVAIIQLYRESKTLIGQSIIAFVETRGSTSTIPTEGTDIDWTRGFWMEETKAQYVLLRHDESMDKHRDGRQRYGRYISKKRGK